MDLINKDIDQLLRKFQQRKIEDAKIYKEYTLARDGIGLPRDFEDLSPANRTSALATALREGHCCKMFVGCASRLNILRTAQGPLGSVTSGIRSYVRFTAVLGRTPFPPSEDTIRVWSCIFKPGRTYQNYLPHVKKACFLLDLNTSWDTPAARAIARGLENSQDRSFAFPNFIFSADLLAIFKHEGPLSPFFQAASLSYLFSLRVPSETLELRRAFADDPLTEFAHQTDKALIGIRPYKGRDLLVVKFAFRKNIRGGCVLFRPCIFFEKDPRGRPYARYMRFGPSLGIESRRDALYSRD